MRAPRHTNLAGAIYGVITATAVIAASAAHGGTPWTVFKTTTATLIIFWMAHVYAEILAHHVGGQHRPSLRVARHEAVRELPFLTAPALSLALLGAGALGLLPDRTAITFSLWVGVIQLFGWAFAYARQQGWSWLAAVIAGGINGAFGASIVLLKALLH